MLKFDLAPAVGLGEGGEVGVQTRPVQGFDLAPDGRCVGLLGLGVHFGLGVQGVEHESGGGRVVDVLQALQVVGVSAHGLGPAGLERTPGGVVEHVAGRPVATTHLPDRLLGERWPDPGADGLQRPDVTRGGQSEPVTEAGGGVQPEPGRGQPGQRRPEGGGVLGAGLRHQPDAPVPPLDRAGEPCEGCLVVGHRDQPLGPVAGALQPVGCASVPHLRLGVGAVAQRSGGRGIECVRSIGHGVIFPWFGPQVAADVRDCEMTRWMSVLSISFSSVHR